MMIGQVREAPAESKQLGEEAVLPALPTTMTAFVTHGSGRVGFMRKPVPTPGPRDAVVSPTCALLCAGDLEILRGELGPRPDVTLGHQMAGIVQAVGAEVRDFKPGDRVVVAALEVRSVPAGPAQARAHRPLGQWRRGNLHDGVLADHVLVEQADANMAGIPVGVTDEAAVYCAETMPTAFRAISDAQLALGGTVAVFGQGPLGLMVTAGARLAGAGLVIAVEGQPDRKELALRTGADLVVDSNAAEVGAAIRTLTAGRGVDVAVDATPAPAAYRDAMASTCSGGTLVQIGHHGRTTVTRVHHVTAGVNMAERTVPTGLRCPVRQDLERALRLLENERLDPTPLTSHTFVFRRTAEAFDLLDRGLDGVIKVLIVF